MKSPNSIRKFLTAWIILLVCAVNYSIAKHVLVAAYVSGHSMVPTLKKGDFVIGVRVPQRSGCIWRLIRSKLVQRRAIVLVRPPAHLGRLEVTRIGGLPGELRSWGCGMSRVTGQRIPDEHVFLIGDAVEKFDQPGDLPADSRLYGPCPSSAVVARIFVRYWPIARIGYLGIRQSQ